MENMSNSIVALLKIVVYAVVIAIGSTMLLTNPTNEVGVIPIGTGLALLLHAAYLGELRRIEYAIVGLYGAVLTVLLLTAVAAATSINLPNIVTADVAASLLLAVVLVAVYFSHEQWEGQFGSLRY